MAIVVHQAMYSAPLTGSMPEPVKACTSRELDARDATWLGGKDLDGYPMQVHLKKYDKRAQWIV